MADQPTAPRLPMTLAFLKDLVGRLALARMESIGSPDTHKSVRYSVEEIEALRRHVEDTERDLPEYVATTVRSPAPIDPRRREEIIRQKFRDATWSGSDLRQLLEHYDVLLDTLAAERAARLVAEHRGCPCLHTAPCDPRCTCVNPASSRGCRRCCSYGSPQQQAARAEHLVAAEAELATLRQRGERLEQALRDEERFGFTIELRTLEGERSQHHVVRVAPLRAALTAPSTPTPEKAG